MVLPADDVDEDDDDEKVLFPHESLFGLFQEY